MSFETGKNLKSLTETFYQAGVVVGYADDPETRLAENAAPSVFDIQAGKNQAHAIALQEAEGIISGSQNTVSSAATASAAGAKEEARRKEREEASLRDRLYMILLEQLRADLERLALEIERMETIFEEEYGDAWREEIAIHVLDPDEMPQRLDGESLEDYRARLEQALMDKMLNPDGTIKDEYKTGPYARFALWAQTKYQKQDIDNDISKLTAQNLTPEEVDAQTKYIVIKREYDEIKSAIAKANDSTLTTENLDALQEVVRQELLQESKSVAPNAESSMFG